MKTNQNIVTKLVGNLNLNLNLLATLVVAGIGLSLSACANNNGACHRGGGEHYGSSHGGGEVHHKKLGMFADNEIGRMVTTQEMKNLVDMCEARGLTQEEAIGEFHRRFGQPKATFSFTGEWPTSSSGRGRSESRGYDSGSASPSDSRLPSEGESLEGGAKMQPASLRYDRGDRDDGGLQEAPRRTYRGRSVEPDDEPAPARRGRDYSRPTALETADDEFWNNAPDGSSTGKYHYPPSTLARSRKVRAQAERDEARFARD